MTDRIRRDDVDGLAILTLDRPAKLNALDTAAFEELDAHLADLEQRTQDIGCVILRGAGRAFCAGADLKAMGEVPVPPRYKPGVIDRVAHLPQPVIASVHGACYTGGLELALACDFIVADRSASFADTHGRWGLVGEWGITQRLPRRVGAATAKRMMMTAAPLDAMAAHACGLVDQLVDEGELAIATSAFATEILRNSWHTTMAVKRLIAATSGMTLEQGLAYAHYRHPGHASDSKERIERFHGRVG